MLSGLLSLFLSLQVQAQAPGCPNIVAGPPITLQCTDSCTQLSSTFLATGETTSYGVSSIPYAPPYPYGLGTPTSVGDDDIYSGLINIPFTFCFFGNTYNQLVIGSNGVISFDASLAGGYNPYSFSNSTPSPSLPTNSIMGIYHDIDPSVCGAIRYANLGSYPCRTFVVNFDNVCHFSCNNLVSRHQIVIYESTNAIEVYVESKPTCASWNSGNALIGIQNAAGNVAYNPPNRNTGPWTVNTPEAWRFLPNGTPNYSIEWTDQSGTVVGSGGSVQVCPTANEVYTAEITYTNCDGSVVVDTDNQAVNFTSNLTLNTVLVDTSDCGQSNGSAQASVVSGGGGAVQWLWDNGETTALAVNLSAGFHCVTATDASGCSDSSCVFIPVRGPFIDSMTSSPDTCVAGVGSATVNFNGGLAPITFQWDDPLGQTVPTAVGLSPGFYELTLTDAAGCVLIDTAEVLPLGAVPSLTAGSDTTSCNGSIDGRAWVLSSGGDAPYTFQWNDVLAQTTDTAIALSAGQYQVAVADSNGCSTSINVEVFEPSPLTINSLVTDESCGVLADGSITLQISGGSAPYQTIYQGQSTPGSTFTLDSLVIGSYFFRVFDASGCSDTLTLSVGGSGPAPDSVVLEPDTCLEGRGSATLFISNASAPITYQWNDPLGQTTQTATGLSAGVYTVLATDALGCEIRDTVTIDSLGESPSLIMSSDPVSCLGYSDGIAVAQPSGGVLPLTIQWNDPLSQSTDSAFGLSAGLYSVVVSDAFGCSTIDSVEVSSPALLTIAETITDETCFGSGDGSFAFSATGGSGPFTWDLDTLTLIGVNVLFDNLQPGTYQVTVTDGNACQANGSYSIAPGTNINLNLGGSNVACQGGSSGQITVSSAGVTAFQARLLDNNGFLLQSNATGVFNNLSAGTYQVEFVEDGTGCRGDSVFTLSEPLANSYSAQSVATTCNGDADGSLEVFVSAVDSSRTFTYQLLDVTGIQPSPLFENLSSGQYNIIVIDDLGCSDTLNPIQVSQPQAIGLFMADQYLDYGDTMTLALDSLWNGIAPFEYLWSPTAGLSCDDCSNPIATPYITSDYMVTVSDSSGCVGSTEFTLFVGEPLDIYIPNAFTPNGDGQNDVFEIYGVGVSQVDLTIYNRWGQEVFQESSNRPQWDGMFKGKMQPPGMYSYLVEVWFLGDHVVKQKGSVALIR